MILILFACNSNSNEQSNEQGNQQNNENDKKVIKLQNELVARTKKDLKKYGIKKVLLYNGGRWVSCIKGTVLIKKDGTIINNSGEAKYKFLWKVENNQLFVAFNYPENNKFIKMIITAKETSYSPGEGADGLDDLRNQQYCLALQKDENTTIFYIYCYKKSKISEQRLKEFFK